MNPTHYVITHECKILFYIENEARQTRNLMCKTWISKTVIPKFTAYQTYILNRRPRESQEPSWPLKPLPLQSGWTPTHQSRR